MQAAMGAPTWKQNPFVSTEPRWGEGRETIVKSKLFDSSETARDGLEQSR